MAEVELKNGVNVLDEVNDPSRLIIYPDVHWTVGADIVPSRLYQVFHIATNWAGFNDEILGNSFDVRDAKGNLLKSGIAQSILSLTPEERIETTGVLATKIKITPNEELKKKYPTAIVKIDGVDHDLAWLDNKELSFDCQNKNHFIDIHWSLTEGIVESFRISQGGTVVVKNPEDVEIIEVSSEEER